MKKFRVEVDGEEFIVNIEEIADESGTTVSSAAEKSGQPASTKSKTVSKSTGSTKSKNKKRKESKEELPLDRIASNGDIIAPMPGSILEVDVTKGDSVEKGDLLMVLEAMKMENEITSPKAGTVKEVHVRAGDSVDAEDLLLVLE
ncbi:biotin/lipoyl-binding protein [Halanaerobium sp. Z-7514]|uniref:Biotin/lipoyl-binding protein n=1 Tax=Halanaerobium polyolivorans TaxID=2886943 RepID=A0AAW4WY06_9FIRM|nr:biotin/lipoyl-containing protein [Halanaerobium polyolivorans]MCC3144344.1 biotin/lipoyl-binding protein [Halanaerobium polyolivorans]RQD75494.1 MAG: biotin/lipoyl-binding protein [Halanaerobium sp. MSAO_Bac5]